MGEGMLRAALRAGAVTPGDVRVADVSAERRLVLEHSLAVATCADPRDVADSADLIVLAVKPQEFPAAAGRLRGRISPAQTVVSIMAGVRIETIARALGHGSVVRVMPNTPATIGRGMSVWIASPEVADSAREQVRSILVAMGREVAVSDERYIDMATALSGSGPGFVYLLMEAFVDAGVHIGFRRDVAELLSLQTFLGSATYAESSGRSPVQLRAEVTSPAGTTAAGILALEQAGIRAAIIGAVQAAYDKARDLGR